MDFAVGLVDFTLNLPERQVKALGKNSFVEIRASWKIELLCTLAQHLMYAFGQCFSPNQCILTGYITLCLPSFQLNKYLVLTISNIMETDATLLQEAQLRSKACSRFVLLCYYYFEYFSGLLKRNLSASYFARKRQPFPPKFKTWQ